MLTRGLRCPLGFWRRNYGTKEGVTIMAKRGRPLPTLTDTEREFQAHLKAAGKSAATIRNYTGTSFTAS